MKGPTEAFLAGAGRPVSAAGVASLYGDLIDAMVVDEGDPDPPPSHIRTLACATSMLDEDSRRAVAERVLEFARGL